MKILKKAKGITLVALVVTIIILLILAGITISQLTGSWLFENAKLAKEKQENAELRENEELSKYQNMINNLESSRDIDIQQLKNQLKQEILSEIDTTSGNPTGTVISYIAGTSAPSGYLKCDGTVYNIADYKVLADEIKKGFGSYDYWGGDGETTFAVPNLQGEFLRGYSTGSTASKIEGITTENVGKHQDATLNPYLRGDGTTAYIAKSAIPSNMDKTISTGAVLGALNNSVGSSWEQLYIARPTNTSVLYCIKY